MRVLGSDGKRHPDLMVATPLLVNLQTVATLTVTMSATVPAILTDADAWGIGYQNVTAANGGFTVGLVAGTITVPRAMDVRVTYSFSGITVINGAVRVDSSLRFTGDKAGAAEIKVKGDARSVVWSTAGVVVVVPGPAGAAAETTFLVAAAAAPTSLPRLDAMRLTM